MNWLKYFHTPKTFLQKGFLERSTWIGILIICGWLYHKEINQLIINVFNNPALPTRLIDLMATGAGIIIAGWKEKK